MKAIIVHDRCDAPVFIKISAIKAVDTIDIPGLENEKYSEIVVSKFIFKVKEDFDTIMQKIKEAESEEE